MLSNILTVAEMIYGNASLKSASESVFFTSLLHSADPQHGLGLIEYAYQHSIPLGQPMRVLPHAAVTKCRRQQL